MISKENLEKLIKAHFEEQIELYDEKLRKRLMYDGFDLVDSCIELNEKIDKYEVWTDAEEPPSDDRYVLLSFANMTDPMIGRYETYKDGSGCYFIGDDERSCLKGGFIVNGWMELPKRKED